MNTLPAGFTKKSDADICDVESLLTKRNRDREKDRNSENASWLITFADLMTILLVFSFVMFITNYREKSGRAEFAANRPLDQSASLISVVHADTAKNFEELSVPVHVYKDSAPAARSTDSERIIMKKNVSFTQDTLLQQSSKATLRTIAHLSGKNPSSKIIVTTDLRGSSGLPVKKALQVVHYLVENCSVARKNIYLQSPQPAPAAHHASHNINTSVERPLEVKLIKAFWWL